MNIRNFTQFLLLASLAACGGGNGGGGGGGENAPVVSYTFVRPVQGQTATYLAVISDVANSSATYSYAETITQVNADGSYSMSSAPAVGSVTSYSLGGSNYTIDPFNYQYDNKGQVTQSNDLVYMPNVFCNYTYPKGGVPTTVTQGQSWDASQAKSCQGQDDGTEPGIITFVGEESVTVPAGTFNAYKFQDISTVADAVGSGVTTTTTNTWRNASPSDSRILKITSATVVTGRTAPGAAIQSGNWEMVSYK